MGLLDRLDALDRRLGLAHRPPKRAPTRLARWMAARPWRTAITWGAVAIALLAVLGLLSDGGDMGLVIPAVIQFPLGYICGLSARNAVQAWDAEHSGATLGPERAT